jgi:hypothetical protein
MNQNRNPDQDRDLFKEKTVINNPNQNRDYRDNHGHDNDNGHGDKIPAPTGSALASASLQALTATFNSVNMTAVTGRSTIPMLQFKRDGNGTWAFGRQQTVPEDGSLWAANVRSFKWGRICFNDANKVIGERLVPIAQPMPDVMELPDHGFKWQEQWSVALKCTNGADAGIEVVYKTTTVGGIQAIAVMIEAVRDRLNGGIVGLDKDSYQHSQYGRVYTPLLPIVDWMSLDGPAPAPASAPPPPQTPAPAAPAAEQPRRRRVA